jgi:hypothetical protein
VSRLRLDRKAEGAHAAAVQELIDAGVTMIDRPGYRDGPVTLDRLVDGGGYVLTDEAYASCPGLAAVISEHDPERVALTSRPRSRRRPTRPPRRRRRWSTAR